MSVKGREVKVLCILIGEQERLGTGAIRMTQWKREGFAGKLGIILAIKGGCYHVRFPGHNYDKPVWFHKSWVELQPEEVIEEAPVSQEAFDALKVGTEIHVDMDKALEEYAKLNSIINCPIRYYEMFSQGTVTGRFSTGRKIMERNIEVSKKINGLEVKDYSVDQQVSLLQKLDNRVVELKALDSELKSIENEIDAIEMFKEEVIELFNEVAEDESS